MAGKFEHKELSGSLFINGYKTDSKHPDYTGSCKIDDTDYKIAGWKKTTSNGKTMLSLSFKPADEEPESKPVKPIDDEIMF